jgi:hypothetical protein
LFSKDPGRQEAFVDKSIGTGESQERHGLVHEADDDFGTAGGGSPPRAALLAILVAGVLSMGASPVPVAQIDADRITVQVNEAPLRDLLLAIGDLANVSIVETAGGRTVPATTVTDSFANLPPDQSVGRLLRSSNYILEMEGATLKRVFVLSAVNGPPVVALEHASTKDAQSVVQAHEAGSVEMSWAPMPLGERQRRQPMELLRLKLQSATPEVRLAALSSMHWRSAGDVPVADVRLLAEEDPDPRVQAAAFDVLIQHETTDEWNQTLSKLADQGPLQRAAAQAVERLTEEATAPARVLPEADH